MTEVKMYFNEILDAINIASENVKKDRVIRHVCCDSRIAGPYSIFVCIKGAISDGHMYARHAYNNGCRAFIAERKLPMSLPDDVDVVYTDNSRHALADASAVLYRHPSDELCVIGVTGTKGKTTTALMIYGILNNCGLPAGYIGSNGILYGSFSHSAVNTTPESCDIQRYLREMLNYGMKFAVIEVSSQALYLERVRGINFNTCIFTNLSRDHIGGYEHPTFEHYRDCKASLFSKYSPEFVVVNADDDYSDHMIKDCAANIERFGIDKPADHSAENIVMLRTENSLGMKFDYIHNSEHFPVRINFPGGFSISNALAAIAVCRRFIPDTEKIMTVLGDVKVAGRFEIVNALPYATVIIDYAHNGASMKAVLDTLRMYSPARIITLFGSVGCRTQMRRRELGEVASVLSDYCILTSDNPDSEDPEIIMNDIAASFPPGSCEYIKIADRREAIRYAMSILQRGDILLLAGKGHEDYQLINARKVPFCERDIVLETALEMAQANV